jgi:hypothetical protein
VCSCIINIFTGNIFFVARYTRNVNQNNLYLGQDSERVLPEHSSETLPLEETHWTLKNKTILPCLPPSFILVSCSAYSSTLMMEAIRFSETSVDFQRNRRRYITEDSTLQNYSVHNAVYINLVFSLAHGSFQWCERYISFTLQVGSFRYLIMKHLGGDCFPSAVFFHGR